MKITSTKSTPSPSSLVPKAKIILLSIRPKPQINPRTDSTAYTNACSQSHPLPCHFPFTLQAPSKPPLLTRRTPLPHLLPLLLPFPTYQPTYQPTNLPTYLPTYLPIHPSTFTSPQTPLPYLPLHLLTFTSAQPTSRSPPFQPQDTCLAELS